MEHVKIPGQALVQGVPVQGLLPVGSDDEGDLRLYRMVLPFLPPSKNVMDNWPAEWRSSAKKKWIRAIGDECRALMMPRAEKIGLAAVLVFPTAARRDIQNYSNALWHWVPDALVRAGVIDDDRDGMIEYGPNLGIRFAVDRRVAPKAKRQRTHLAITLKVS